MADFAKATAKYKDWLLANNVRFLKNCEIEDLRVRNEGRGVIAHENIMPEETIFEIPRTIILNVETCAFAEKHPEILDQLELLNQWEALIIVLLYEIKVQKSASKWAPYFDVLPILDTQNYKFNQIMFWSDDECESLKPSLILQRIGRDMADGMYRKLFPKIVVEKMNLVELEDTTLLEYHQVASLIMSYSFDIERLNRNGVVDGEEDEEDEEVVEEEEEHENNGNEQEIGHSEGLGSSDDVFPDKIKHDEFLKAMIPLADTLNADTNLHNASLEYQKDKLVIRAIKPIAKGDQIYNTYSDHPNSEILRRYGYVERKGSKHDFGEIPMDLIKNHFQTCNTPISSEFFDELLEFFTQIVHSEPDDESVDFVLDSYDCFRSSEVIIELIILVQCLTVISAINAVNSMHDLTPESRFQLIRRIYRKCIQLIESKKLTQNFLSNYKAIVEARLDQYPKIATEEFKDSVELDRKSMAHIVLKSEYKSLVSCLNIDETFKVEDGKYEFINDDKLIRNIVKKKFDLPIPKRVKK